MRGERVAAMRRRPADGDLGAAPVVSVGDAGAAAQPQDTVAEVGLVRTHPHRRRRVERAVGQRRHRLGLDRLFTHLRRGTKSFFSLFLRAIMKNKARKQRN